ncbi:MAG: AsmA family protein [Rhabdochlamydiaceae bacterium]|nr:AsmA family protein [Rhabdochlamydiaceae bacterium]
MKKFLYHLVGWTAALCILLVIAAFFVSSHISNFTAKSLSTNLGVPVTIGNMQLWLDHITAENLDIENLPSSYLKQALKVREIRINANITNYLDKVIKIDTITMDNIYLGLEFDSPTGATGNWTTLMSHSQSSETPVNPEDSKSVLIKELVLTNIQIDVVYKSSGGKIKKLPPIPRLVLYDINTDQGLPTEQIMQSVVGKMLQSIFVQENMKNMFDGILDQPKNAIDTIITPFKGLF